MQPFLLDLCTFVTYTHTHRAGFEGGETTAKPLVAVSTRPVYKYARVCVCVVIYDQLDLKADKLSRKYPREGEEEEGEGSCNR